MSASRRRKNTCNRPRNSRSPRNFTYTLSSRDRRTKSKGSETYRMVRLKIEERIITAPSWTPGSAIVGDVVRRADFVKRLRIWSSWISWLSLAILCDGFTNLLPSLGKSKIEQLKQLSKHPDRRSFKRSLQSYFLLFISSVVHTFTILAHIDDLSTNWAKIQSFHNMRVHCLHQRSSLSQSIARAGNTLCTVSAHPSRSTN